MCETQSTKYVSFTVTNVKFMSPMTGKDGELESVLKNSKSWPGKNSVKRELSAVQLQNISDLERIRTSLSSPQANDV